MEKAALGIDARDVDLIIGNIEKITPQPTELLECTPDNDYVIYYWEDIFWEGPEVEELLKKLGKIRHALYTVSEEGEVTRDIKTMDFWGEDEEFCELLGSSTDLTARAEVLGSARRAANIEWDSDGVEGLPRTVLIPDDIEDDMIADYLSDRYGFLVYSYTLCGTRPRKKKPNVISIRLSDDKELAAEINPEYNEICIYLKKDGCIWQDLVIVSQKYGYEGDRRVYSDQYSVKIYTDENDENYTEGLIRVPVTIKEYKEETC